MKRFIGIFFEKLQMFISVGWTIFCILGAAASATRPEHKNNVPFCLVCMLIGLYGIWSAKRKRKLRNRAEVYAMCMADKPESELAEIARTMNIPLDKVVSELEELISKDYLNNIYIDRAESRVKLLSGHKDGLRLLNGYRFVTCKSCGGSNRIVGDAADKRCSYCKAPLDERIN